MRRFNIQQRLLLLLTFFFLMPPFQVASQPNIPIADLPANLSQDITDAIYSLYDKDPKVRAFSIMFFGGKIDAHPFVVPYLKGELGDDALFKWNDAEERKYGVPSSTPGRVVAKVLASMGPKIIPDFVEMINPENYGTVRHNSVLGLTYLKDDENGLNALINQIKARDSVIRGIVTDAFLNVDSPKIVEPIISALKEEKLVKLRIKMSEVLKGLTDIRSLPLFIDILKNTRDNEIVRENAAEGLSYLNDPGIIEPLIEALEDSQLGIQKIAVSTLIDRRDPRAVESLLALYEKEKGIDIRIEITSGLSGVADQSLIPFFEEILSDIEQNIFLRRNAVEGLKFNKGKKAIPSLIDALDDKDLDIRLVAAEAFIEIKSPKGVLPLLVRQEKEEDDEVLEVVGEAIKEIIKALVEKLNDAKKVSTRIKAAKELAKIDLPEVAEALLLALKVEKKPKARSQVISALAEMSDERKTKPLLDILYDKKEKVKIRSKAASGLANIKSPEVTAAFITLLSDDDAGLRKSAAGGFVKTPAEGTVKPLMDAFKVEKKKKNRILMIEALKKTKSSLATPLFVAIMKDKAEIVDVRVHALEALKDIKDSKLVDIFISSLDDEKSSIRGFAAEGLMTNIHEPKVVKPLIVAFKKERLKKTKLIIAGKMKDIEHPLIKDLFMDIVKDKKESSGLKEIAISGLKKYDDPILIGIFSKALKSKKKKIRRAAIEALQERNVSASTEVLLTALKSEKIFKLRMLLTEMLSKREHPKIFLTLIDVLNNENEHLKVRRAAADGLKNSRESLVVDSFILTLGDVDLKLREKAAEFLLEVKVSRALLPLKIAMEKEKDDKIRDMLSRAMDKTVEPLVNDLSSKNVQVRLDVASKLVDLENGYVLNKMSTVILSEKNQSVREVLSEGLKKSIAPGMFELFMTLFQPIEKNIAVRLNAAEGLVRFISEPRAVKAFLRGVSESDKRIREVSIRSLANIDTQEVLDVLIMAMKKEEIPELRIALSENLKTVEEPDLIGLFISILQNKNEDVLVRGNAVEYLGQFAEDKRITEPVLAALTDDDPGLRIKAADALTKSTDKRIVLPLMKVLQTDKESSVKVKVSKILFKMQDPRAVHVFLKVADNVKEDKKVRINALKGLLKQKDRRVSKVLLSVLNDADVEIRRIAAGGFRNIKYSFAVKPLLIVMKLDEDKEVREKISFGLKSVYIPETKKLFLRLLNNKSESAVIRLNAANYLSSITGEKVFKAFVKVLKKSRDVKLKEVAARTLSKLDDRELSSIFFSALKDRSPIIRYYAVKFLKKMKIKGKQSALKIVGKLNAPKNIKVMTMATFSRQSYIRSEAAGYLAGFADSHPSVILFIADLLTDHTEATWGKAEPMVTSNPFLIRAGINVTHVGEDAADALARIGKPAVEVLIENLVLNDVDNFMHGRRNAVRALTKIKDPRVAPAFLKALKRESDKSIRVQVTSVLANMNNPELVNIFKEILDDKDEFLEVRLNALNGLKKMKDPTLIPYYTASLNSDDSAFRRIAVEALADLYDPIAEEALLSVLLDKDPFLRKTAARAFKTIPSGRAVEPLKKLLGDDDPMVRYNSVLALRFILGEDSIEAIVGALKVPIDIKNSVRRLYSDSPRQRGRAAKYLAKKGNAYPSIIAFLVEILPDITTFEWETGGDVSTTSPGREAVKALINMGEIASGPLISVLGADNDLSIRQYAAKALGEISSSSNVEPIIEALKSEPDPYIRENLCKALKLAADPRSIDIMIEILGNRNEYWPVRYNAAEGLAKMKDPKVVEPLIKAFGDKDSVLRGIASAAFINRSDERAEKPLLALLDDEYVVVRNNAAEALRNIEGGRRKRRKFTTSLVASLDDLNPEVRISAAETLGKIKSKESAEKLKDSLNDPVPEVRKKAIEAMVGLRVNSEIAKPLYDTAMYDSDPTVRALAAKEVGALGETSILLSTIEALKSDSFAERESAVIILSQMKKSSFKYLLEMLNSKDAAIRKRAVEGLLLLRGNMTVALTPLMEDLKPEVRVLVTKALGGKNYSSSRALEKALTDKNASVREQAAESLGNVGTKGTVTILLAALEDEKKAKVRKKIVQALGKLKKEDQRVRFYLEEALLDDALSVRKAAVLTLGSLGYNFSYDLLLASLTNEGKGVQKEAARALGMTKDRRAIDPLIAALASDNVQLTKEAAKALKEITEKDFGEDIEKWNDWNGLVGSYEKYEIGKAFVFPLILSALALVLI